MKHKTAELERVKLNHAVALAERLHIDGVRHDEVIIGFTPNRYVFEPTTNWEQGGPIIERERIHLGPMRVAGAGKLTDWIAQMWVTKTRDTDDLFSERGDTALIAAMRCLVASKFGDEVDLPA
jgi:hypothetical protein